MSVLEQARQIQAQTDERIVQGRAETQELKELLAETLAGIEGADDTTSPKPEDNKSPAAIPWAWLLTGCGIGAGVVAIAGLIFLSR